MAEKGILSGIFGGVTDRLSKEQKVGATVAGLSFGLGLPLWLLGIVILAAFGVGIWLLLTMLPVFVAGGAFFGTFYLINRVESMKVDFPYNYIIPFIAAFAAWAVVWIPGASGMIVSQAVSSSGASAATAAAVEAQFLGDVGNLLAAPTIILSIMGIGLAIVVMNMVGSMPVIGKPIAALIGIVAFAVLVLGVSLSGIIPSALGAEATGSADTIQITFYVTDSAGNQSYVELAIQETGESDWTSGGIAIFDLEPNSIVHVEITHAGGTSTRVFSIGSIPKTITIKGISGLPEG